MLARGSVLFRRQPAPSRHDSNVSLALAALLTAAQIGGLVIAGSSLAETPASSAARTPPHTESITYIQDIRQEFFTSGQVAATPARGADVVAFVRDTSGGESDSPSQAVAPADATPRDDRSPLVTIFDRPCVGPACA